MKLKFLPHETKVSSIGNKSFNLMELLKLLKAVKNVSEGECRFMFFGI